MKTVDRYLSRHFLLPLFVSSVVFIGLVLFVDSAEKFRTIISFAATHAVDSKHIIASYLGGSILIYFITFLPFLFILTAAIMHVNLNKTGQLRALYSFGLRHSRIFLYPKYLVFSLGVILLVFSGWFLPQIKQNTDQMARQMKGSVVREKAFVNEEFFSLYLQQREQEYQKSFEGLYPAILRPPAKQVVYYMDMMNDFHFQKVIITRLDVHNNLRQRITLLGAQLKEGYFEGETVLVQDFYANGDLYQEKSLTHGNGYRFYTEFYGEKLLSLIEFRSDPSSVSMGMLFKNYSLKEARFEIFRRLLIPIKCVLLFSLALAISSWLDLKKFYMSFGVLIGVVVIDFVLENFGSFLFQDSASALPLLMSPILLWLMSKFVYYKAHI